ncbi:hypothetical protein FRB95_004790 [Tulasnella sp. JGI-2019a]|nr:hypothetical protein FRB95_004790 [Tulasnella sp. JGI-2019a]
MDQAVRIITHMDSLMQASRSSAPLAGTSIQRADHEFLHLKKSFDACLATFSSGCKRALAIKARQRNSLLPVYHLPSEVLIQIFHYYTESEKSPHCLALVSSMWATIVMESPTLWGYIHSSQPRATYLNSLARSKETPLQVSYIPSHWNDADPRDLKLFIESVCAQVHRWQSAILGLDWEPELSGALASHLTSPAPLLEKLEILANEYRFPIGCRGLHNLFGGVTPRLRSLEVKDVYLPWDSGLFLSRLHTLKISGSECSGPSTYQMVQILRGCPGLTHFSIFCHFFVDVEEDTIPTSLQPINLPAINDFSLHHSPEGLNYILKIIRIPTCARFHISSLNTMENVFSGTDRHLIPVLSPIVLSAASVWIMISTGELMYRVHPAGGEESRSAFSISLKLYHQLEDASPLSSLAPIPGFIHSATLSKPISLTIATPGISLTKLFTTLHSHFITKINVREHGHAGEDIISFLAQPVVVRGTLHWRVPTLRELSFEGCYDVPLHEVLSLVESRLGQGGTTNAPGRRNLPVKLTKLCLPVYSRNPFDAGVLQKLRSLVDDVEPHLNANSDTEDMTYGEWDGNGGWSGNEAEEE